MNYLQLKCLYSRIFFVGILSELEDEDDKVVPPEAFVDATGMTLSDFIQKKVPEISVKKENVADINTEKFEEMTRELEKLAKELQMKDDAWKEEVHQLELKRMEDQLKIDELESRLKEEKEQLELKRIENQQKIDELESKLEEEQKAN